MTKHPRKSADNVVSMPANIREGRPPAHDFTGAATAPEARVAGAPDDPRMREAMRLMQAFLAIEDERSRAALVTLAERMVSFDWVRKVQQR